MVLRGGVNLRISSDKSKNTLTILINRSEDEINSDIWNELFGEKYEDFDICVNKTANDICITYSIRDGALISNCSGQLGAEDALSCLCSFAEFVFEEGNNQSYIIGATNVFYNGEKLRFLKAPVSIEQSCFGAVKYFLDSIVLCNPELSIELKQRLTQACDDETLLPDALINEAKIIIENNFAVPSETEDIYQVASRLEKDEEPGEIPIEEPNEAPDEAPAQEPEESSAPQDGGKQVRFCPNCGTEYEEDYVFCIKCGEMLQTKTVFCVQQEENAQEIKQPDAEKAEEKPIENSPSQPVNTGAASGMYGETTLLGFTNFGETSILGGNMNSSYDMPNLIRASTGEKIYITKRNFLIGKSRERADYCVENNNAISRVHAEIIVSGNDYYIADKGSTNHTYVNNSMVQKESSVQIHDGDEIKIADEVFTFSLQ